MNRNSHKEKKNDTDTTKDKKEGGICRVVLSIWSFGINGFNALSVENCAPLMPVLGAVRNVTICHYNLYKDSKRDFNCHVILSL
jgi:hypothetical protein